MIIVDDDGINMVKISIYVNLEIDTQYLVRFFYTATNAYGNEI